MVKSTLDRRVVTFLTDRSGLCLSVIVLHELDFGLSLIPHGRRRDRMDAALCELTAESDDRILPVRRREAAQAALLRAQSRRLGRVLHLADALIAGTANAHGLTVATRNVGDFDYLDVAVINPWEPEDVE